MLKNTIGYPVRHADLKTHLAAAYTFTGNGHTFNYDFAQFWRRRPSEGAMRPLVRSETESDPAIEGMWVGEKRPAGRQK